MSKARATEIVKKIVGFVVTAAGFVTFGQIKNNFGDIWDAIVDNPFGTALVIIGLALVAYGYWDVIFRSRITAIDKQIRNWLDMEKYSVKRHSEPPNFRFEIIGNKDKLNLTVSLNDNPRRLDVSGAIEVTEDEGPQAKALLSNPAAVREVVLEIQKALIAAPASSVKIDNAKSPRKLSIAIVIHATLEEELTYNSFFQQIQLCRKCVMVSGFIMGTAAARLYEADHPDSQPALNAPDVSQP